MAIARYAVTAEGGSLFVATPRVSGDAMPESLDGSLVHYVPAGATLELEAPYGREACVCPAPDGLSAAAIERIVAATDSAATPRRRLLAVGIQAGATRDQRIPLSWEPGHSHWSHGLLLRIRPVASEPTLTIPLEVLDRGAALDAPSKTPPKGRGKGLANRPTFIGQESVAEDAPHEGQQTADPVDGPPVSES